MIGGYAGKLLFVDLSTGQIEEEELEEKPCLDYIGGYGMGARLLYDRQKGGYAIIDNNPWGHTSNI